MRVALTIGSQIKVETVAPSPVTLQKHLRLDVRIGEASLDAAIALAFGLDNNLEGKMRREASKHRRLMVTHSKRVKLARRCRNLNEALHITTNERHGANSTRARLTFSFVPCVSER
jgi:hypothetical protein